MVQNIHRQTIHLMSAFSLTTFSKKNWIHKKFVDWVPHELIVKNLLNQVSICFRKEIISGKEKWIICNECVYTIMDESSKGRKTKIFTTNDNDICLVELIWNCLI